MRRVENPAFMIHADEPEPADALREEAVELVAQFPHGLVVGFIEDVAVQEPSQGLRRELVVPADRLDVVEKAHCELHRLT
uniref:Uncharacterized protein n=1 Tax=Cereibacter sphaeroides (strain ATCC 17025 / ATH 2.4.3) TaxID=349102 RepID=A4WTJ1_CERS5